MRRRFLLALPWALLAAAITFGVARAGQWPAQGGATGAGGQITATNVVGGTAHAVATEQGGTSPFAGVGPVASGSFLGSAGVSSDPAFVPIGQALDILGATPGFFLVRSSTTGGYTGRALVASDLPLTAGNNTTVVNGVIATQTSFWGDGSSGSGTLDGSTTVFGLVPSGNTYTATANIYATNLTINTSITLALNNYLLFCTGALTLNGTAVISCDGGFGATTTGFFTGMTSGASGSASSSTDQVGVGGTANTFAGAGGGGGKTGGAGNDSAGTKPTPSVVSVNNLHALIALPTGGWTSTSVVGPAGTAGAGGRGSGDGFSPGGNGGTGGGNIVIYGHTVSCSTLCVIRASGGGGSSGIHASGTGSGGGGGGQGGVVFVFLHSDVGAAATSTRLSASGGSHGNGAGTGSNGGDGVPGTTAVIAMQ